MNSWNNFHDFFCKRFLRCSGRWKWLILLQVVATSGKKLQVFDITANAWFVASGIAASDLLQLVNLQVASTYHLQRSHMLQVA